MSTKEQGFEPAAIDPGADRQLKAKHRALWASGDYPAVSAELIPTLGPELVRASGVRAGDRVLDVAAGSGNAAIAAAGAIVTASDLTPELFARSAHRRGTWGRGGMGGGRRGGVAVCGQRFRRRDVAWERCSRRTTRPPPTSCSECAGQGTHRNDQLDAGGSHRQAFRDDTAVGAAGSTRREPGAAVGR